MSTPAIAPSPIPPPVTDAAPQRTLAASVQVAGVGLHLGQQTTVRLIPTDESSGRVFVRTDLPGTAPIPATVEHVIQTRLSTELGLAAEGDAPAPTVRTVEHLLSALFATGIDNVRIEIDGPEVPLLDGSAKEWMSAIAEVGTKPLSIPKAQRQPLNEPITVHAGDAWVSAIPGGDLRYTYGIDFDLPAIGNQWHSWSPPASADSPDMASSFLSHVAPARTFGLEYQIDALRAQGLIKGGSLDNALVCGKTDWVNPPLRFENEPARHKLLDLVGDLALLGGLPAAHYIAYKASHQLHVALARKLDEACPTLLLPL